MDTLRDFHFNKLENFKMIGKIFEIYKSKIMEMDFGLMPNFFWL